MNTIATLNLTLSVDKDVPAVMAKQAMRETLALLDKADLLPLRKVTFAIEVVGESGEVDAIDLRNDLKVLLCARPYGIDATIELKNKEDIHHMKLVKVTPMDAAIREAEGTWRDA